MYNVSEAVVRLHKKCGFTVAFANRDARRSYETWSQNLPQKDDLAWGISLQLTQLTSGTPGRDSGISTIAIVSLCASPPADSCRPQVIYPTQMVLSATYCTCISLSYCPSSGCIPHYRESKEQAFSHLLGELSPISDMTVERCGITLLTNLSWTLYLPPYREFSIAESGQKSDNSDSE
jgi:hypothetical protein